MEYILHDRSGKTIATATIPDARMRPDIIVWKGADGKRRFFLSTGAKFVEASAALAEKVEAVP
jgi:hypothetical protein